MSIRRRTGQVAVIGAEFSVNQWVDLTLSDGTRLRARVVRDHGDNTYDVNLDPEDGILTFKRVPSRMLSAPRDGPSFEERRRMHDHQGAFGGASPGGTPSDAPASPSPRDP